MLYINVYAYFVVYFLFYSLFYYIINNKVEKIHKKNINVNRDNSVTFIKLMLYFIVLWNTQFITL